VKQCLTNKTKFGSCEASLVDEVRGNYDKMQSLSAEKLALARKVYAYVDANLSKISQKMKGLEEKDESLKGGRSNGAGKKDE
jgi:hypothetical protein